MRWLFLVVVLLAFESPAFARYTPRLLATPLSDPSLRLLADRIIIIDRTPRAPMEPPPAKWAACWSFVIPGLGQLVLGKPLRGALFAVGAFGSMYGGVAAASAVGLSNPDGTSNGTASALVLAGVGLYAAIWVWSMVDAWALGESIDGR